MLAMTLANVGGVLGAHLVSRDKAIAAGHGAIVRMIRRTKHQFLVAPAGFRQIAHRCRGGAMVWMRTYLMHVVIVARVAIGVWDQTVRFGLGL